MDTAEQLKQHRNSVAESLGSLTLGILGVSMVGNTSWATYTLLVIAAIIAISGIYLMIPFNWKQESFLEKVATKQNMSIFKAIAWFIVFVMFGYNLIMTRITWLIIIGFLFMIIGYAVLCISIRRARKSRIKEDTDGK